ncbi:MAG: hypothetical protein M1832_000368 [Thelocarpon impressellum]|nr:MAG: hypothetical protein M1832_000368 [Thelocarpon impressellum]
MAAAPAQKARRDHAHTGSEKLEDQAATAALYVTMQERSERTGRTGGTYPLDADHKLSSAGAAASLKHAHPHDLPGYPVLGLADGGSSADAAANLANRHHQPFELWKPAPSASASAAAVLAKDYRPAQQWQPQQSAYGSRAALLAAQETPSISVWKPTKSGWVNSAAEQAARHGAGAGPQPDRGDTADGRNKSLIAAAGAMSGGRKRADSTPASKGSYPDAENSAANALSAASLAARPAAKRAEAGRQTASSLDAARIHNVAKKNVSREMYTSHPPVAIEVDERKRADTLRAAAISMAKQMYSLQEKAIDEGSGPRAGDGRSAARLVQARRLTDPSSPDSGPAPMQFHSLEDAARKLAAERLAKLHDEHAAYRNYYGASPPASRVSLRAKPRRRASSESRGAREDEERSRRIRSEMSLFGDKLAEVDTKKRQRDRDALMAAAQRNVRASIHGMDERVYADTGKVSPAMMEEWEAKARARAEAESQSRLARVGKVDVGGGRLLDQADVDAVALRNVQPVLDEINEKAERQRARQEELRLERDEAARLAHEEKAREREVRAEQKRHKEFEKEEERRRRAEEKAKKTEEKRRSKELKGSKAVATEKREDKKTTEAVEGEVLVVQSTTVAAVESGKDAAGPVQAEEEPTLPATTATWVDVVRQGPAETGKPATLTTEGAKPIGAPEESPTSPHAESRVRSWLKDKFARRGTKGRGEGGKEGDGKGFVGGAALTGDAASNSSVGHGDSARDVALAGREETATNALGVEADERPSRSRRRSPSPSPSPVSSVGDADGEGGVSSDESERRDTVERKLAAPPTSGAAPARRSEDGARDSRFSEEF